jgi:phage baseplate assembly protein W
MPLYGPRWPLKKGNEDVFELYDDVNDQISFYLKCLILTSPGENLSDPNYGVGLRRFLFEQNNESTRDSIASAVSRQISRYLPYLNLENVEVGATSADIDMNSMSLRVIYSIPSDATQQIFELDLNSETTIGFY